MESNKDLEQKIKDELEIGFKKLNFAIQSYSEHYTAYYTAYPGRQIVFRLQDKNASVYGMEFETIYEAFDKLTEFKKEAINICSHQKKERH